MRHLITWLIAAVFVINGAASPAWIDPPEIPESPGVIASHGVAVAAEHHAHSHQNADDVVAAAQDHCHGSSHTDNRLKCCSTCSVASLAPDIAVTAVTFSDKGVMFHAGQHDLFGHVVAVDPGIPKILV